MAAVGIPAATLHVWPYEPDGQVRCAADAFWLEDRLYRVGADEAWAPIRFPIDVRWDEIPGRVVGPAGGLDLWRGCLYVEPDEPVLVRGGFRDLPGIAGEYCPGAHG